MNHFHPKSLAFYGIAISLVLALFKIVTAFGEKHLQASPVLNSNYRLTWADNVPNCPVKLNIQQSGIYLNASLLALSSEKPLALTGIWQNQKLTLVGKINQTNFCNFPASQTVEIQMRSAPQGNLQGELIISTISQTLKFNATPEAAQVKPENSSSH
jgi:hypothetical protein